MSELVDRAKASLEGVDPYTPWDVEPFSHASFGVYAADSLLASCPRRATAEFIAAARRLVPELIAEVERLERALEGRVWELDRERDSHLETAAIMRRTRERAERLEKRAIPESVTRIDMIDPKRHEHWSDHWSVSIQDEGRTLKLFAEGDGSAAREERDAALAKAISEDLRRLGGTDE